MQNCDLLDRRLDIHSLWYLQSSCRHPGVHTEGHRSPLLCERTSSPHLQSLLVSWISSWKSALVRPLALPISVYGDLLIFSIFFSLVSLWFQPDVTFLPLHCWNTWLVSLLGLLVKSVLKKSCLCSCLVPLIRQTAF